MKSPKTHLSTLGFFSPICPRFGVVLGFSCHDSFFTSWIVDRFKTVHFVIGGVLTKRSCLTQSLLLYCLVAIICEWSFFVVGFHSCRQVVVVEEDAIVVVYFLDPTRHRIMWCTSVVDNVLPTRDCDMWQRQRTVELWYLTYTYTLCIIRILSHGQCYVCPVTVTVMTVIGGKWRYVHRSRKRTYSSPFP